MKQIQPKFRIAAAVIAGVASSLMVVAPLANAGPDEDQRDAVLALRVPHAVSYPISFIPGPIGSGAGSVEFGTNLGLKHLPAYMQAPPEVVQRPNGVCKYFYSHNAEQQYLLTDYLGVESWSGVFDNASGSPPRWKFGPPEVIDHYHSDVLVSVRHKNKETGEIEILGVNPDDTSQNNVSVSMRTGVNLLTWRADTTVTPLLDYVPWHAFSFSSKNAGNAAGKAAKTPGKKALALQFLVEIAKELTAIGADRYVLDSEPVGGVYTEVKQRFVVIDENPPEIHVDPSVNRGFTADNPYPVRAVDPGGSYFASFSEALMENFSATDDCAFGESVALKPVLTPQVDGSLAPGNFFETNVTREIIIQANDKGPIVREGCNGPLTECYTELDTNETTLSFWVRVEDNEAPLLIPPKNLVVEATPAMEAAGKALRANSETLPGDPAYVEVGNAAVFDLGDRYPSVDGDEFVTEFPVDRRTTINWSATDIADNSVGPVPQVITVKTPGTNTTPTANAESAIARVSEPVEITLRGSDPDMVDGVFDPVNFEIARQPENGFLLAPPNPYFIEDYRRTWQEEGVPCNEETDDTIKFPEQVSVADNGTTYILTATPRICNGSRQISIFDKAGDYIGNTFILDQADHFVVLPGEPGVFTRTDEPSGEPILAREPGIYFLRPDGERNVEVQHRPIDEDGNVTGNSFDWASFQNHGDRPNARRMAVDSRGYVWLHDGFVGIFQLQHGRELAELTDLNAGPNLGLGQLSVGGASIPAHMATDSEDFLYVTRQKFGRVYKFAPAMSDPDEPIKLIGWMGRCSAGQDCDVENKRSFGFSCTDETCSNEGFYADFAADRENELVACGLPRTDEAIGDTELRLLTGEGCQPGQFNDPTNIAIDANNNFYVADYGNRRVQRFTSDGGFTGEAKSTCDGSCFVLGDFGRPMNMTVNSFGFYVLDEVKKLLHVFEASPFSDITPNSAVVKYQSNHDILGAADSVVNDSFDFTVNDGLMRDGNLLSSEPFTVNLSVTRNFRAPTAVSEVLVDGVEANLLEVQEDTPQLFELQGRDPDVQDEDHLTFEIVTEPEHGSIIETADGWEYQPNGNFFGDDQFAFVASDTVTSVPAMTSEPALIQVRVLPVPDPVLLEMPESSEAGIGFPVRLIIDISDVDTHAEDVTARIEWGDGCVSSLGSNGDGGTRQTISCQRTAPNASDQTIGSMALTLAAGNPGKLILEHLYTTDGDFNVSVCVGDSDGEQVGNTNICNGPVVGVVADATGQTTISVSAKADVVSTFGDDLERDPDTNDVVEAREAGVPTNMHVVVRNQQPSTESNGGETSVVASMATIKLFEGLAFVAIPINCTPTLQLPAQIVCPIPPLAPGEESARIDFSVVANPALTEVLNLPVSLQLNATESDVDGVYYWATALPYKPNPALDPDGDGVPNADDAFPGDPNEWTDTDSDGVGNNADLDDDGDSLSDTWEKRYGFDSLSAADADADMDGDGLSNRLEAMNGTHPASDDSDRDGHKDDVDNCPAHFNQQQYDENGDFLGDACDSRSYATVAGAGDADGDSVVDTALTKTLDGMATIYVKSGASDNSITSISAIEEPSRMEALLRIDNLDTGPDQALAVLYTDDTGDAHARTFDAWTSALLADFPALDGGATLIAADVVAAGNDELLILGRSDAGILSIYHRNARNGNLLNSFEVFSRPHDGLALAGISPDAVVVLAVSPAGELELQSQRIADGTQISARTLGQADRLQARLTASEEQVFTLTTAVDGQSEVSVWTTDLQAVSQFDVFDDTWMPFAMRAIEWNAGTNALAVAASTGAGDIEVRVYDPNNGADLNAVRYLTASDTPRGMIIAESAAGESIIGVLASDASANVSLEQRAAATGEQLTTLTAASLVPPPPPPPPPPTPSGGGGGAAGLPLLMLLMVILVSRRDRRLGN